MTALRLVVLGDAHLGAAPPDAEPRLLAFLERAHEFGDALLVIGDLFDFWFTYGYVVPRRAMRVAAALVRAATRLPVTMVGGNHDRWDRGFWRDDLGIPFHRDRVTVTVGGQRVLAVHGDGLTDPRWRSRLAHRVVAHPVTSGLYRLLHPDLGFPLVHRLAPHLGDRAAAPAETEIAAERQRAWAEATLRADPAIDVLVMGHTHRASLVEVEAGRRYLNPGAWFDGGRYAVVTADGAELRCYEG